MLLSKIRIRNLAFVTGFYVLVLYNFHRYIFKYNFEGTSPTYTNTPTVWKIGKYVIVVILLTIFFKCLTYTKKANKWFVYLYALIVIILFINVANLLVYKDFAIEEVGYCFWFLLLIPYWFVEESIFTYNINYHKLIKYSGIILLLSNGIAVANYLLTGRLPALGYEDGLVRFGGFWDDPNGFGLICIFYFYYFIRNRNYLISLAALISIALTFSFTAYLLLIASIGYWIFSTYTTLNKKWAISGISIVIFITAIGLYFYDTLMALYIIKSQSVSEHLTKDLIFSIIPLQNSSLQFSENWYQSSFYNYFPFSIFIHLAFLILFLSLFKNSQYKDLKFYFFLFVAACFFFSMLYSFPLNFVFIFLMIDYLKRRPTQNETTQSLIIAE